MASEPTVYTGPYPIRSHRTLAETPREDLRTLQAQWDLEPMPQPEAEVRVAQSMIAALWADRWTGLAIFACFAVLPFLACLGA